MASIPHKAHWRAAAVISVALLSIIGCRSKPEPTPVVVARVGNQTLTESEVEAWEASLQQNKIPEEARSAFIRRWIEEELLAQAAQDRGLLDDPWVQTQVDETLRKLLTARLIEIESANIAAPTRLEIETYFKVHQDEFVWERLHMKIEYWQSSSRPTLERLRRDLASARPTPLDPKENAPVDSGQFEITDPTGVDPSAWKLFGRMNTGQLSYPIYFRNTYWMFRMQRRDEAGSTKTMEDVREEISARLLEGARAKRQAELIKQLTDDYRKSGKLEWPFQNAPDTSSAMFQE